MLIAPNPTARGALYKLEGVPDVGYASEILAEFGIDGGRFVSGRLEIADTDGRWVRQVRLLAEELELELTFVAADIDLL